ncbi:hypothetical protein [Vibrio algarum]|uniref:DUF952 domain-containing protein n=1 Tax=Vibrio algarum TaxID=3020714 RepID=A0ABT4YSY4_9VIBR|nr:hypothetical protein [Vibrio sp. KJ40-1]MDB1124676.1 hypothetical protein [Vibrio sp. KJ40-1]
MYKIPKELNGSIWHSTSTKNWQLIKETGAICTEPPEECLITRSRKNAEPFIQSLKGISLFDLRKSNATKNKAVFRFIPGNSNWNGTVWLEIDIESIKNNFWSAENATNHWRESDFRNFIPHAEGACFSNIPLSAIKTILIYERNKASFRKYN